MAREKGPHEELVRKLREQNIELDKKRRKFVTIVTIILIAMVIFYVIVTYFNLIPERTTDQSILVAILGMLAIEIIATAIYQYMIKGITSAEAKTLADLFRVIGYSVLVLILLALLVGVQYLTGFLVGAGFLGIVIGLAAQSTLSNFISGVYLLASRAFEPNDNVMIVTGVYSMLPQSYPHDRFIPGFMGTIENIGLLYTKLINDEGIPFYVPNSVVSQAMVINYHRAREHTRRIQFDINIDVPYSKIERLVGKVMKKNRVDGYSVAVEYLHIGFYVVTIHVRTLATNIKELKSELFQALIHDFHSEDHEGPALKSSKKRTLGE